MRISAIFRTSGPPGAFRGRLLLFLLCLAFPAVTDLHGADTAAPKVAVFVSQDIRPYIEAVEGMSAALAEGGSAEIEVFSLAKIEGKSRDLLMERVTGEDFALSIAIGPEAVRLVSQVESPGKPAWMYSMILNPPGVCGKTETACGLSLDLPARRQLEMIALGLPTVRRLGLLFDPRCNGGFSDRAGVDAASFQLGIVPLPVTSKKDIPAVLKQHWQDVDALWLIPDQTVISESIVQYIIKEALLKGVPVVGYNRFFYESGAALAFVFDYGELGRQTGRIAADLLAGKACEKAFPVFRVWRNRRVMNKLGISVPETATPPIEEGP